MAKIDYVRNTQITRFREIYSRLPYLPTHRHIAGELLMLYRGDKDTFPIETTSDGIAISTFLYSMAILSLIP